MADSRAQRPTQPRTRALRCPYCVEGGNFNIMMSWSGGDWYMCARCGHVVLPKNKLFQCPCLKCYELEPPLGHLAVSIRTANWLMYSVKG
jgi:hypothetical protein